MTEVFLYPESPLSRRHGPAGYQSFQSYVPWLRDEFSFRCVYCLRRENWGVRTAAFAVDHHLSLKLRPDLACDYDNLLYSCSTCNSIKGSISLPDPTEFLLRSSLAVHKDGRLETTTPEAAEIVETLRMDARSATKTRNCWVQLIQLAKENDLELYLNLMGPPEDLPDLDRLKPPSGNSRPRGIIESYHAKRLRGEIPSVLT